MESVVKEVKVQADKSVRLTLVFPEESDQKEAERVARMLKEIYLDGIRKRRAKP
jgi:hypothetical protein